ncbi:MAG: 30S ribosomal protein S5 [Candidatus Omnitrophica bacterium 4484_213]|nr:MAG: 30S ribosomal protein S5 [Candidatus Omnitrophica bacterium 4484_213]
MKTDKEEKKKAEEFVEKLVDITRVAKVIKGGRHFAFRVSVVVGDGKGKVGYGIGKAGEIPAAVSKAAQLAKKNLFSVPLKGSTIPHEVIGNYGAAKVLLKPARRGTGVIASKVVKAMCECVGIRDILTKCLGTTNPLNVMKAVANGFASFKNNDDSDEERLQR